MIESKRTRLYSYLSRPACYVFILRCFSHWVVFFYSSKSWYDKKMLSGNVKKCPWLWETFCHLDPSSNVYLLAYVKVRRWTLQEGNQMALFFHFSKWQFFAIPKFAKVEKHRSILGWHIVPWCQHLFLASSVSWSQPHFSQGSIYYILRSFK